MAHCCEHPGVTDVICDDYVVLYTQYSTQWDSFAHVGSMFDVHGTGEPVPVYYNGYAGGEHIQGASRAAEDGEHQPVRAARHIGTAYVRERVCLYGSIFLVGVTF